MTLKLDLRSHASRDSALKQDGPRRTSTQRRRYPLERLVEQQAFCADAECAAKRDQLLLAPTQQQRLAMAHLGEFADHLVHEIEPRPAIQVLRAPSREQD